VRTVRRIRFPPESRIHPRLREAYYADAFEAELADASLTPAEIFRRTAGIAPGWVHGLMRLRDALVRPLGLKTVSRLDRTTRQEPVVGEGFSIFRVIASEPDELVLGIDDTHLDVRISYLVRRADAGATYVVASWVKTHNALGRLYMWPVAPFHRLITTEAMRGLTL
jgi:hypothetical protein